MNSNSLAYDMYKLMLANGLDVEIAKSIKQKFDTFYDLIEKEMYHECDLLLINLRGLLGKDHQDVFRASSVLELERE